MEREVVEAVWYPRGENASDRDARVRRGWCFPTTRFGSSPVPAAHRVHPSISSSKRNGALVLTIAGAATVPLVPISRTRFVPAPGSAGVPPDVMVWFDVSAGGLVMDARSFTMRAERTEGR